MSREYRGEETASESFDRQVIWRLLSYLKPYRWLMGTAMVLLLVSRVIEAAVPILLGRVTQLILDVVSPGANAEGVLGEAVTRCSFILGLLFTGYLLDGANLLLKNWIGQRAIFTLRLQVFRHIQQMHLGFYDRTSVGRLITRTIHDVDQINQMFAESVVPIIGSIFLLGCILLGVFILDWQAACVILAIIPAVWWLTHHFRRHQRYCYDRMRAILSSLNVFVQEHLMGAATIRNFGLQKREQVKFDEINEDLREANLESHYNFSFFIAGIGLLQSVVLIVVFAVLVLLAAPETGFRAGTFFSFSLYALMFFRPLGDLAERYNTLQAAMSAARNVFAVLDRPSAIPGPVEGPELHDVATIEFDKVWFAYQDEEWVLKGISFSLKKGESVALVGDTGSGKTTVISLLLRLYDIQKGQIRINGRDIKEYPLAVLRRQFGVVLQDPVIFSGTIRENIALYRPKLLHQQIADAVDYVNLRPFIDRFSNGLDHTLSERGSTLSTGEMQLIALARAIAQGSNVLVLDEATASIDTRTETIIQAALKKVLSDKTSIVIAHRLSTIKHVTRILVVYKGEIREQGTHQELLDRKGIYEKLYRLQFVG